jgi:hypothetical protein
MSNSWQVFKVNALSVRHSENNSERLVSYNINLPVHLIPNGNVYNVIRDTIVHDFDHNPSIYFQISAVYTLVNRDTGALRTWTGSFNPRNRQVSQLSPHQRFEADSFVNFARANCSVEVALQKLTANSTPTTAGKISVWSLQDLKAIIFSFQCRLRPNHRLFQIRPQLRHVSVGGSGASATHKHAEFNLEAG